MSQRIMSLSYSLPSELGLSPEVLDLFSRIFVLDPTKRISIPQIRLHPWFRRNLPVDLEVGGRGGRGGVEEH